MSQWRHCLNPARGIGDIPSIPVSIILGSIRAIILQRTKCAYARMSHFRHEGVLIQKSKHHGGYAVPAAGVDGVGHARRPRCILAIVEGQHRRFYTLYSPRLLDLVRLAFRQSFALRPRPILSRCARLFLFCTTRRDCKPF